METKPNFEEKEFESAVNDEFFRVFHRGYSPGQRLEHFVGFDRAVFVPFLDFGTRHLFGLHGDVYLDEILHMADRELPHFKVNLFFQYKRVSQIEPTKPKNDFYGGSKYFKYDLDSSQLSALRSLDSGLNDHAKIYYCAPAFIDRSELFRFMAKKVVAKRSNYTNVRAIQGAHSKITFTNEGFQSTSRSDPNENSSDDFFGGNGENRSFSYLFRSGLNGLFRYGIERFGLEETVQNSSLFRKIEIGRVVLSELNLTWLMNSVS